jgi:hypothetical protein
MDCPAEKFQDDPDEKHLTHVANEFFVNLEVEFHGVSLEIS